MIVNGRQKDQDNRIIEIKGKVIGGVTMFEYLGRIVTQNEKMAK